MKLMDILREVTGGNVENYYKSYFDNYQNDGKIKNLVFHGTDKLPSKFEFDEDYDYENAGGEYDFDLPYGVVFLTSDFKEAATYGRYVIPCYIKSMDVKVYKVKSNAPSQVFDDDYQRGGKMFSGFEGHEVLEVRGIGKSTYITYPELVMAKTDIAEKVYEI